MVLLNFSLFFIGCVVLWKASGLVIRGVEAFSKNLRVSSFATSFLILGILTSLTEISVGLNSVLEKKPEIFVGNLIGGSFVILLLIIPFLAVFNKGIFLKDHLDPKRLMFFLVLIVSPSFLILDGMVSRYDAWLLILLYGLFFYLFQQGERILENVTPKKLDNKTVAQTLAKIVGGAVLIYIASRLLVESTIYFADLAKIPPFLVSLLILSVGTNLPELVIAANSILRKRTDVAFGDYVGSAAANPLLFGIFTLLHGPFTVATGGFDLTFLIIILGYILFFMFARSKQHLSRSEGLVLILVYLGFILVQIQEILLFSPKI